MRKVNLQMDPLSLPPPLCWSHDFALSYLALWELPIEGVPYLNEEPAYVIEGSCLRRGGRGLNP